MTENGTFALCRAFFCYLCIMQKSRIAIVGAGAAGCFAAQRIQELCPFVQHVLKQTVYVLKLQFVKH